MPWQVGVVRVNCFDSLDRTNMAQATLARRTLEMVLTRLGLMMARPGVTLASVYQLEDAALRVKWADHGDELAREYAGSGASQRARFS